MDGSKTSLGANVEVVCLLQAAEIERLSANLEDYRLRYYDWECREK